MHITSKPYSKSPDDCSIDEIADFIAMVLAAGEVTQNGLKDRIRSAVRLGFLREENCLAGVAALKHPALSYRSSVASSSGTPLPSARYPFELGWVYILPIARGKKYSSLISDAVLAAAGTAGVFATSRTSNFPMHRTLDRLGFVRSGKAYVSRRGSHELQLFVREHDMAASHSLDG